MQTARRWRHWHASSLAVLAAAWLFFLLVAVPGGAIPGGAAGERYLYFGWPYVHFLRYEGPEVVASTTLSRPERLRDRLLCDTLNGSRLLVPAADNAILGQGGFWSDPANWRYLNADSPGRILWGGLAANMAACLFGSTAFGALFEFRRRHRRRLLQFTMRDLLACISIAALALAFNRHAAHRAQMDQHILAGLRQKHHRSVEALDISRPERVWLSRLSDYRLTETASWPNQTGSIMIAEPLRTQQPIRCLMVRGSSGFAVRNPFDPRELGRDLQQFADLEELYLEVDDEQFAMLDYLPAERIRAVTIDGPVTQFASLTRFHHLERLTLTEQVIASEEIDPRLVELLRQLPALKVLQIRSYFRRHDLTPIQRRLPGVHVTLDYQAMGGFSAF